jgi:hypothetical protein
MKHTIDSARLMHPTHTTRQASHPSRLPGSLFDECPANLGVSFAIFRTSGQSSCEDLGRDALGKSENERCRQPRSSGFSSHRGQYGRVIVHALFPQAMHLSWNPDSWMDTTTRECTIEAPHTRQSSVLPNRRHRRSRNSFSNSLNWADVMRVGVRMRTSHSPHERPVAGALPIKGPANRRFSPG